MKTSAIISFVVAVAAIVGLSMIFVQNASPYLTINQLQTTSKDVHVVGKIVPGTLQDRALGGETRFRIQDATGELDVVYTGPNVSNLATATQVVVIGDRTADGFHSKQMLVKCPSKYESERAKELTKSPV